MIENLLYIAVLSRPVASSIVSLGWVQDGVDGIRGRSPWLGEQHRECGGRILGCFPRIGLEDGIDEIEVKAIEGISNISYWDAEVASSVVSLGWVAGWHR